MPARKSPGPSVKDPELYEELRDDGASKEKAARISNAAANTSRSAVGRKGGRSGDYDDWTKADLMNRAREIGIRGRSSMTKSQLIDALRTTTDRRLDRSPVEPEQKVSERCVQGVRTSRTPVPGCPAPMGKPRTMGNLHMDAERATEKRGHS